MSHSSDIPLFFIVSKGRSGSTLLLNLLDANPHVIVPLESTFLIHLYSKYKYIKKWDKRTIDSYLVDLYRIRKIRRRWKLDKEKIREELYDLLDNNNISYANVSRIIYLNFTSIFPKKEILLVGDKNPIYTFCIKEIKEIYPKAKIIHLVRDPRANVRSHIVSFNVKFLSFIAFKWYYYNKEVEQKKEVYNDSFFTVRYEDLVETPEKILIDVCDFLNIPYNSESLNFHKKIEDEYGKYKKYKEGYHASLTKPIDKNKSNKWKSYFNKKQLNIINHICIDSIKKYNYEFSISKLTLFNKFEIISGKLYYKLWQFFVKSFFKSPFWVKKIAFKLIQLLFK